MSTPQEPKRPAAAFREAFGQELRREARDVPGDVGRGFFEDLAYGLAALVGLVVLVGGGALVGAAVGGGAATLVGALVGGVVFVAVGIGLLVKGGIKGTKQLRS
jgi:hypothetical protein